MPTMLDVARKAGVALSTVSYALNGTRPISEETRRRIFAAIEELGYRPHALARGLASKRSRIIALLFPTPERGFGITELEFVTSAADAAKERGYHLILWPTGIHDLSELERLTQQGLADGVVVMEVHMNDERINLLRKNGVLFSMIGRCTDPTGISYVDIDFEWSMQEVVRYLSALGHTHIAFLNQSQAAFDAGYGPVVRTHIGFRRAVQDAELNGIARFCRAAPWAGYEAFNELLTECPDLTAIVTMNERAIPGIMQAIADRGWHIPEDFSLVGIASSARLAEMTIPPLTTADAPIAEMGRLGVELLINQLEAQERSTSQMLLPCSLVIRGSSGPSRRRPSMLKRSTIGSQEIAL
ncbi:MAG: LacI family DNA-binding transcriptional regulator [Anaerolineae bacterium]|nr:LacI family transcriptional regulator [Anaerolineae bacterium]MDW8100464.1 LacI family DNA-binding transcriptional regulator [Anaerolineae bacterium]